MRVVLRFFSPVLVFATADFASLWQSIAELRLRGFSRIPATVIASGYKKDRFVC
jgi:hypothetical protein